VQIKECTHRLVRYAKDQGRAVILIGQMTADGGISGPKTLAHLVDVIMMFEAGEGDERVITCPTKNRFGRTRLKGRFMITGSGLEAVPFESTEPDNGPINSFT